jgi:hypothetical protein
MMLGDVCACITAYCRRTHGFVAHAGRPAGVKCPRGDSIRLLFPGRRARPPLTVKREISPCFRCYLQKGRTVPLRCPAQGRPTKIATHASTSALRCAAWRSEHCEVEVPHATWGRLAAHAQRRAVRRTLACLGNNRAPFPRPAQVPGKINVTCKL